MCDSQVKLVPGEAVWKKLGAFVVLVWYFGLKRLIQFPPHRAHTGPETTFLFEFITLRERTAAQNGLLHSSDNISVISWAADNRTSFSHLLKRLFSVQLLIEVATLSLNSDNKNTTTNNFSAEAQKCVRQLLDNVASTGAARFLRSWWGL